LASARHFPSVNWLNSYSEYLDDMANWWQEQVGQDWRSMRAQAMAILTEESRLQQVVKLVGPDALPDEQRLILEVARLLSEGFLQQDALDDVDAYATIEKQIHMLRLILHFYQRAQHIIEQGVSAAVMRDLPVAHDLIRMKSQITNEDLSQMDTIQHEIDVQMDQLEKEYA
jgi:V/A-type H+-transporting ATPase subunit A